ncbi:hypothetical protein F4802DRAFT_556892 [Xylaria palmicola]|nr:hypothetical protein F4802DRAFT_556892 [Xylaria palmicola]
MRTTAAWPPCAATTRAVQPSASRLSMSAPCSTRTRTTSSLPFCAAIMSAVQSRSTRRSMSAPWSSSSRTTSAWLLRLAQCSADRPPVLARSASAPSASRVCTMRLFAPMAATATRLMPSGVAMLRTSIPRRASRRKGASSPSRAAASRNMCVGSATDS